MKKLFPALLIATLLLLSVQPALALSGAATSGGDLWVDSKGGIDTNNGATAASAFRTIQAAAKIAGAGTTVHILPGIYRESVVPASSGTAAAPVLYTAENGPGTVIVRGSVPSSGLAWTRLASNSIGLPAGVNPANIYYTDLSAWGLAQPPRYIVQLDGAGNVAARFMPAREPDWQVQTRWKPSEFWWLANGGSAVAGCNPIVNSDHQCDMPWRSYTQLTDTSTDTSPAGVEPGNLTTLGNLTGATLVALDAQHGHYLYRGTIVSHDLASGRVTIDQKADNDGTPGLGWGTKYYVENHPALLDQPGEWWFDAKTGRLYMWAPNAVNPAQLNLEISRRNTGFDLTNRSYITLSGLTIELFNQQAYQIRNANYGYKAFGNVIQNCALRYANRGVELYQYVNGLTPAAYAIDGFTLKDSEIAYMDTSGLDSSFWWPGAPSPLQFTHSGVRHTLFQHNHFHDLGFNSEDRLAVGIRIQFPDKLRFVANTVDHTAQAGAHFLFSLIDSTKQYGFSPQEIKLADILVFGNVFDKTCVLASDCGALKFGGSQRPYTHVFRNVLIMGNVFRNGVGWSYASLLRGKTQVGDANGFYLDHASGVYAYRNIVYNNTGAGFKLSCLWRDGDAVFYNNVVANNYMFGFKLTGVGSCDNHNGSVNTQVVNNILINNDAYGLEVESAYNSGNLGNLVIDHNLYYLDGWNSQVGTGALTDIKLVEGTLSAKYFHNLSQIRLGTPWEAHGMEGNPGFAQYDPADHNRFDNSWPDFHLTAASSNAIDRGSTGLPPVLSALLTQFGLADVRYGAAFDIGRYELATGTPALSTSAASFGFGLVRVNSESAARDFTISNTGNASLAIGAVSMRGPDPGQFHITADTCSGRSIAPAGSCHISATFAPAAPGTMSAYVSIPDNSAGSPHRLVLGGKGAVEQVLNGGLNLYPSVTAVLPTYWGAASFAGADGKDVTYKQEGTASVRIANTSSILKRLSQTRSIAGAAGNTFKLSVWARANNVPVSGGSMMARVLLYNGAALVQSQPVPFPTGTYPFTQKTVVFTAAGAYNRVVIDLIYSQAGGAAWFDAVSLLSAP